MGLEARCTARYKRQVGEGLARLETTELRFKGEDLGFVIPFARMKSVVAARGVLEVRTADETAKLELGSKAETWALKIRYPKPVIDKLGVKAGQVVSVLGVDDPGFLKDAGARAAELVVGKVKKNSDLVFFGVTQRAELSRLARLEQAMKRDGAIWVIWKKGVPTLREDDVRAAALELRLVDVKVVAFSESHSGLKLMIRKNHR
ncbi:MAG TPA: hypothetical protein VFQ05_09510 [Candidatus Eisenbacteria bacterium]|nr:hypothetical protein [Candidatus Eisenbacteria bacterium]